MYRESRAANNDKRLQSTRAAIRNRQRSSTNVNCQSYASHKSSGSFTARRYGSAVFCCRRVSVRPSVRRPSQAGIVSRRLDESSRFWHGDILPPIAHCYQEIWVSPKDRVLPCGTLSQTPDSENIAAASRSRCQQNSSTVELVDDTNTTIDESWLFTTSRSTVTL